MALTEQQKEGIKKLFELYNKKLNILAKKQQRFFANFKRKDINNKVK